MVYPLIPRIRGAVMGSPRSGAGNDNSEGGALMTDEARLEANKELVRRMNLAWSQPDTSVLDEIYHEDYEEKSSGLEFLGLPALKEFHRKIHAACPGYTETTELLVAEGDRVAVKFISRGTITAGKYWVPPRGQSFEHSNTGIYEIEDGKLKRHTPDIDFYGLLTSLGAIEPYKGEIFE
jgi:predicted ester cyclase